MHNVSILYYILVLLVARRALHIPIYTRTTEKLGNFSYDSRIKLLKFDELLTFHGLKAWWHILMYT